MKFEDNHLITETKSEAFFIIDELKKTNNFFKKLKNDTIYNCGIGCDANKDEITIRFNEKLLYHQIEKIQEKIRHKFIKNNYKYYN